MAGEPVAIGPFLGGLNTASDPTAVADNELTICENFELDLDGSLVSRPAITYRNIVMPLGATGNVSNLGFFFGPGNVPYLLASDGLSSTYYYDGTSWNLITNTFAASAMVQFNGLAWLTSPTTNPGAPGGSWSPSTGFVAVPNMPHGEVIVAYKFRLWIAQGRDSLTNPTRMYMSNVLGAPTFWQAVPDFIDVGAGDGQSIVQISVYYNSLIIFRTGSIYSFQYTTTPTSGVTSLIVPNVGLASKESLVTAENYIYFMFDDKAYSFVNNRAAQINQKVDFVSTNRTGIYLPYAVSVLGQRVIFSFWDQMYVYNIITQTWTSWVSPSSGPIGEIATVVNGAIFSQAVLFGSLAVPPSTTRINLSRNPKVGTNTTDWAVSGSGTAPTAARTSGAGGAPGVGTTWYRATATASGTYMDFRTGGAGVNLVTPGVTYTFSSYLRSSSASDATTTLYIEWLDSTGAQIGSVTGSVGHLSGTQWGRMSVSGVAPAGAVRATIIARALNSYISGDRLDVTGFLLEASLFMDTYFDGDTVDTFGDVYSWVGTANASTSTDARSRYAKTLHMTDSVTTEVENFVCTMVTKNFNYDAASVRKRLFWWGVDASFRGLVTATVTPITFVSAVTWSSLRLKPSWGWNEELAFTWSQPSVGGTAVISTDDTAGTGSVRKFVKFLKSLRFRQINYKLVFVCDGSINSAPIKVFSLMTYVTAHEVVSKTIS